MIGERSESSGMVAALLSLATWFAGVTGCSVLGFGSIALVIAAPMAHAADSVSTTAKPRVTFSVKPTTVSPGGSSKLWWSTKSTTSCTASGGWSGARPTNGEEFTGPLYATTSYTLTCSGPGGTLARTVTVAVNYPAPTLTFTVNPLSVTTGGASTLSWSATNATSCTASNGWGGTRATSGSESTGPLSATTTFTLACTGNGGTVSQSVTVTAMPPPAPTLTLSASPLSLATGGSSTLTWAATNANSCTASGGWTGAKGTNGAESTGPLTATTTFTLDCSGDGGSVSKSVTVTVADNPPPAITLTANPLSVTTGETSTLVWSTDNATSCLAHDAWSGSKPTSGSETSAALTGTSSFTLECTGNGGSAWETVTVTVVPKTAAISRAEAFRFLNQATFGPTEASVAGLTALGDPATAYGRWIDGQLALPVSLQLPKTQAEWALSPSNPRLVAAMRRSKWFDNAINGPDQLRQRVTFALSQILVASEYGPLWRLPLAVASYNDTLAQHALGNYRDLLRAVTLHPAMGLYLSMLGNQKGDPAQSLRADENFARELMQLFTIGLVQLNQDGSVKLDEFGQPIPTYDQSTIENLARVFTGWTYAGASSFATAKRTNDNQVVPMQAYPEQHDAGAKTLLSYPGAVKTVLPAGQSAEQDLDDALDNIFHHPNVGPFVAKRLIERLVTSNPTPAYVGRVAAKFNDDGTGQRGNLAAVVRAILLDPEARATPSGDTEGKLKEPLLRMVQFLRAYEARAANGEYRFDDVDQVTGQGPLLSPSVFNFFSPTHAPSGEIADRGLVAPELEIVTEFRATTFANYLFDQVVARNSSVTGLGASVVVIDIGDETALAGDPTALARQLSDKLLGGQMSAALETEVIAAANRVAATKPADRVEEALFLVVTSPEFATLR